MTPRFDGDVVRYEVGRLAGELPRIYYVNGIRTLGPDFAKTATFLAALTERPVFGVYNATGGLNLVGSLKDLGQCAEDWLDGFGSKLGEVANAGVNKTVAAARHLIGRPAITPFNAAEFVRSKIPAKDRVAFMKWRLGNYNKATASLFHQLQTNLGPRQVVIAHSQGNLITAEALWSIAIALGEGALSNIRVYSLASPAPAWPLGIRHRRKVYGNTSDLVTLADPHNWTWITSRVAGGAFNRTAGDWRPFGTKRYPNIDGHAISANVVLNFSATIRADLGLAPEPSEAFKRLIIQYLGPLPPNVNDKAPPRFGQPSRN